MFLLVNITKIKKLRTFKKGGIHPPDMKISRGEATQFAGLPDIVNIPLGQHIGAPAKPIVKRGDHVKVGDLLAVGESFISANIHSSVSGVVRKLDTCIDASGYMVPCITIKVEGDEWNEDIDRTPDLITDITLSEKEIIDKIKLMGVVGLGGAAFPTHVKVSIPEGKKADYLIINAVECEPYLTSDHRMLLEKPDELLIGTKILMYVIGVKRAYIGIEINKPDAVELLMQKAKNYDGIDVVPLKVKYPQGAEKQLIKAVTGREIPSGKLPIDIGCVVNNSGSTYATYEAVQKNKPLFERIVTITGKSIDNTANLLVRVGTPVSFLLNKLNIDMSNIGKVISGGPMMGKALSTLEVPVVKGTSGILLVDKKESKRFAVQNCIRCSRCVEVCPMGLEPYLLANSAEYSNWELAEKHYITDCFECGSCQYTCPAYRPLVDYLRLGKRTVVGIIKSRSSK